MIQVDEISKKFTQIYHAVDDIKNFTLRIRLVYESFPEEEDIAVFKWQQKRFSPREREHFQLEENCHTDLEKEYHQQLQKETRRARGRHTSVIFSYVERDGHVPRDADWPRRSRKHPGKPDAQHNQLVERINAAQRPVHPPEEEEAIEFEFFEYLSSSLHNPVPSQSLESAEFESFYIAADFGEYYNSTWIPAEHTLCVVKYNRRLNVLKITPDFSIFEGYRLKVTSDETKTYSYHVESASLPGARSSSRNPTEKQLMKPSLNTALDLSSYASKYVHVVVEILSAWNFGSRNVFVRYCLVLNDWRLKHLAQHEDLSENTLAGVTFASTPSQPQSSAVSRHHFAFPIEWHLFQPADAEKAPVVHFEVVSKGTWSRFRTEGRTQLALPVQCIGLSGRRVYQLPCCRVTSASVVSELRRFFIGEQTPAPEAPGAAAETMNRLTTSTISSGALEVSVNVLHALGGAKTFESLQVFARLREMRLRDKLRDPQLTRTVDEAVLAFSRARETMLQACEAAQGT